MADFKPREVKDFLADFIAGMNNDISPELLERNQASLLINATNRGSYIHPRPPYRTVILTFESAAIQAAFEGGLWQGATYYRPDLNAPQSLIASVSGRLYKVLIGVTNTATVTDITGGNPQSATAPQAWLWQVENYVFWNDGINNTVFWDGNANTTTRSLGTGTSYATTTTAAVAFWPAFGADTVLPVTSEANMHIGDILTIQNGGQASVNALGPLHVTNISVPVGSTTQSAAAVNWTTGGFQYPPGKQGVYGLGRVAMVLADGERFVMGDLVGGSSGTVANQFRDAVLYLRENAFLAGGGFFRIPGGDIRAIIFSAVPDTSLGQGPLQIFTPRSVYSCQAPIDRTTWQNLTTPILTETLITNGGQGQDSTTIANSDTLMRAVDGLRSVILGRRDYQTWGNVPQSQEVEPLIAADIANLLKYESATVFDNRFLIGYSPVQHAQGVYCPKFIALNFDPISSLAGKAPSTYDGSWTGMNSLKLIKGSFDETERCFSFCLDSTLSKIKLTELLPSSTSLVEDDGVPITWEMESACLFNQDKDPRDRDLIRLLNGECFIDRLVGTVLFETFYKPDQWPDWVPWFTWTETYNPTLRNPFRPRMGMGEPNPNPMDEGTNRPLREAYTFQHRVRITGSCRYKGARFTGVTVSQPPFALPKETGLTVPSNALAMANAAQSASVNVGTSTNAAAITINDHAPATPFPSTITFTGTAKTVTVPAGTYSSTLILDSSMTPEERNASINSEQARLNGLALNDAVAQLRASTKVTISINGLSHTNPSDVLIMLQSPGGTNVALVGRCGDSIVAAGVNLVLDDAAAVSISDVTALVSGTFKPTHYALFLISQFPGVTGVIYDTLSQVYGESTGVWSLYVVDLVNVDTGSISGGFTLTIT